MVQTIVGGEMTSFLQGFFIVWNLKALGFVVGLLCAGMAVGFVVLVVEHWKAGGWKR